MSRIFIGLLMVALFVGCASEESQEKMPDIQVDEDGVPMACELVDDSFLVDLFSQADTVQKLSEKLEGMEGQRCLVQLKNSNNSRIGQIVMIVQSRDKSVNRKAAASAAKNTKYLEDLGYPASWRSFSNLHTMVFDQGDHTISLNMGSFVGLNDQILLKKAKEISKHIVHNMTENGM